MDRIKMMFWRFLYPIFPSVQNMLLKSHLIWHKSGRQRYHIGWLASGVTLDELKKHLSEEWHFGNHFVAWKDTAQVLSWRRLKDFNDQWHIRVYEDGEIRGHYEKTPESSPIQHFREVKETDRREDFKKFLGDYCVETQTPMHLVPDTTMTDPVSEITFEPTSPTT
jgi:hypothetical protein